MTQLHIVYNTRGARRSINAILGHGKDRLEKATGVTLRNLVELAPPKSLVAGKDSSSGKGPTKSDLDTNRGELSAWEFNMNNKWQHLRSLNPNATMKDFGAFLDSDQQQAGTNTLTSWCDRLIAEYESGKARNLKNQNKLSETTAAVVIGQAKNIKKYILNFLKEDFDFAQYNSGMYMAHGKEAVVQKYKDLANGLKDFADWEDEATEKEKFGKHTLHLLMCRLRQIINRYSRLAGINIDPELMVFFKAKPQKTNQVSGVFALKPAQVEWIFANEALLRSHAKSKNLVDYIIAALYTCARKSDLQRWTRNEHLELQDNGESRLVYTCHKTRLTTGAQAIFGPINSQLASIFAKGEAEGNGKLMPRFPKAICGQLRTLLGKFEIFQKSVPVTDKFGKSAMRRPCDVITFHDLRSTAITRYLYNGISEHEVKAMSGHTGDSASFLKYVKVFSEILGEKTRAVNDSKPVVKAMDPALAAALKQIEELQAKLAAREVLEPA